MDLKKFRFVSKFAGIILKVLAVSGLLIVLLGLVMILFSQADASFYVDVSDRGFVFFTQGMSAITEADEHFTALVLAPIFFLIFSYVMWKGRILFERLSFGETPFSFEFAGAVKQISLILLVMDVAVPLLYSLILTLVMDSGYYFTFGLSSMFLIGLILYVVAGVLSYGVELQRLSDDTI